MRKNVRDGTSNLRTHVRARAERRGRHVAQPPPRRQSSWPPNGARGACARASWRASRHDGGCGARLWQTRGRKSRHVSHRGAGRRAPPRAAARQRPSSSAHGAQLPHAAHMRQQGQSHAICPRLTRPASFAARRARAHTRPVTQTRPRVRSPARASAR